MSRSPCRFHYLQGSFLLSCGGDTMLWHNLRLRTRILIGYGLTLALIVALGLLFMFRVSALNSQIRQLSAEVTTEADASTRLAAQVATTQQAIDRYLQQPL